MLDEILESAAAVTSGPEDYRGEDGLLYCGKCHTPREAYFPKGITLLGRNRHPTECVCRRMEREQQEAFFCRTETSRTGTKTESCWIFGFIHAGLEV
mgnify:CR=1 FL=1